MARKMELQMIAAIDALRAGRRVNGWRSGNTSVEPGPNGDVQVRLHGNLIGLLTPDGSLTLDHCGWHTVTTRSRINALAEAFIGYAVAHIKRGQLLIEGPDGGPPRSPRTFPVRAWAGNRPTLRAPRPVPGLNPTR